jgi:long-chain acyl-CoA synthetase
VLDVSVAGVRHQGQDEIVKAWIVLRGGAHATEEEIITHCREKLAGYKVPKLIEFRDALPKTMVGKVLRRELVAENKR